MNQLLAIRLFIRVVETGSLSKAAASLGMPKSSASKAIGELEAHLGTRLLHRTTRALAPTTEGTAYYGEVGAVVAQLQDIDAGLQHRGGALTGRVRVEANSSMANRVLIPALGGFRARYPGIQVVLGIGDRPVNLIEEGVDCALRAGRLADTSLIARTIFQDRLVTCASPAYLAAHPAPNSPAALRDHATVGYLSQRTGEMIPMVFRRDGAVVEVRDAGIMANDGNGHVGMILHGLGIGQTYLSVVKDHLAAGTLRAVLPDWTGGSQPISILYPPSKRLNARVRVFADWLADHLHRTFAA